MARPPVPGCYRSATVGVEGRADPAVTAVAIVDVVACPAVTVADSGAAEIEKSPAGAEPGGVGQPSPQRAPGSLREAIHAAGAGSAGRRATIGRRCCRRSTSTPDRSPSSPIWLTLATEIGQRCSYAPEEQGSPTSCSPSPTVSCAILNPWCVAFRRGVAKIRRKGLGRACNTCRTRRKCRNRPRWLFGGVEGCTDTSVTADTWSSDRSCRVRESALQPDVHRTACPVLHHHAGNRCTEFRHRDLPLDAWRHLVHQVPGMGRYLLWRLGSPLPATSRDSCIRTDGCAQLSRYPQ